jgi:hypothetical protein
MLIGNGAIMTTPLSCALLTIAMMLSLLQAEDAAPAPATAPAAPAAAAKDLSDSKAVFGIIAIAKDRKTMTLTDGKGTVTKLKITAKTDATIDLKKVDLGDLSTTKSVRVSFTGDTVDSIDQLTDAKKKKKNP